MKRSGLLIAAMLSVALAAPASVFAEGTSVTTDQVLRLYFTDNGRSFGYQVMMARINVDTVKANLARDEALLRQNEGLYERNAIPLIDLQVSQMKDAWNRKQLIVAEKNLVYLASEYEAMSRMAEHFAGGEVSAEDLYATFLRGWEAGCDKGPDEVVAYQAWAAYAEKSLERARQLNDRGSLSDAEVLERKAQLAIAQSNYRNRKGSLDRCRNVLFPTLEDILGRAE